MLVNGLLPLPVVAGTQAQDRLGSVHLHLPPNRAGEREMVMEAIELLPVGLPKSYKVEESE